MQSQFTAAPSTVPHERSAFDRSFAVKTTADVDMLIPVMAEEVLPGDTMNLHTSVVGRLYSRIKQSLMDSLYMDVFAFYVPDRLVWDNANAFLGERPDGNAPDPSTFTTPQIDFNGNAAGVMSNFDYLGIPPSYGVNGQPVPVSALFFRAIAKIWSDWFRDGQRQDLPSGLVTDDGPDLFSIHQAVYPRGKTPNDYFASALLQPYAGTPPVLNLGATAPVVSTNAAFQTTGLSSGQYGTFGFYTPGYNPVAPSSGGAFTDGESVVFRNNGSGVFPGLEVDLSSATPITLNAFREFTAINQLLELDNRGGFARINEIVKSHFNVVIPDARLQRAEFLASGSSEMSIHTIASTETANLGSISGSFGTFATNLSFVHSFPEHGYVIVLACARPKLTYQQGIDKKFQRLTRYDRFWPTFAHLGEQAVLESEIFADDTAADNSAVFGYVPRHQEYRVSKDIITGKLRSDVAGSLDVFHLAQDFGAAPDNDDVFIKYDTPMSRIVAVTTEPHYLMDVYHKLNHVRPMPVFAIPGLTRI
ncbi:MAG: major capsid protein [Microviridae sp.]|nr:MAG: major capsid protein [Microviridae sp.]